MTREEANVIAAARNLIPEFEAAEHEWGEISQDLMLALRGAIKQLDK